ncbi:MAG: hypothetical protein L3K08_09245 [Thermoplasmata archaeon]|nr:hypothetical protein [Thermoplasmata archaeon]
MTSVGTSHSDPRTGGRRPRSNGNRASSGDEVEPPRLLQRWRRRLPDAIPLLLVGVGAFLLAVLARSWNEGLAGSRLPLWSLFTAMGGVVFGGGVTVLVAGGDEFSELGVPACDPTARLMGSPSTSPWPVPEYDEGPPERPTATGTAPATLAPPPPMSRTPGGGVAPAAGAVRPDPTAPAGPARRRDAAGLEQTIREVEATLDEILETSQREPPTRGRSTVKTARPAKSAGAPAPPAAPKRTSPAPLTPPASAPAPLAPVPTETGPPARCIGCGAAGAATILSESCSVCGEPLCSACDAKARSEGHALVCPNCDRLLFKPSGRK